MKSVLAPAVAALVLAAVPARAELLGVGSRAGNFSSSAANTDVAVPINGTYYSIGFTTSVPNQQVRVTYNAECAALGAANTWVAVKIYIDGLETAPSSGNNFALCTASSTTTYVWVGAIRQSTAKVAKTGSHAITVKAYGVGTNSLWLGDSSIVVDR